MKVRTGKGTSHSHGCLSTVPSIHPSIYPLPSSRGQRARDPGVLQSQSKFTHAQHKHTHFFFSKDMHSRNSSRPGSARPHTPGASSVHTEYSTASNSTKGGAWNRPSSAKPMYPRGPSRAGACVSPRVLMGGK
jgi:hypothetical protein